MRTPPVPSYPALSDPLSSLFLLSQVVKMIETYFGVEDEAEMSLPQQAAGPNGTFSFGGPGGMGGAPSGGFNFQQMH